MKKCTKCKAEKNVSEFGKDSKAKDGLLYWCKDCARAYRRAYYRANKEEEDRKCLERYHKYQKTEEFRERRKAYQRKYNADYMKRPEIKEKAKVWTKRYLSNIRNRISRKVSFQIWFSLRNRLDGTNIKNGRHWESLVNWTLDDLMSHLESKFTDDMSWDNYGGDTGWQIDHVVPRTWFEMTSSDSEGFKKCWKLNNLQPLWLKDNASKGNRYAGCKRLNTPIGKGVNDGRCKTGEAAY